MGEDCGEEEVGALETLCYWRFGGVMLFFFRRSSSTTSSRRSDLSGYLR